MAIISALMTKSESLAWYACSSTPEAATCGKNLVSVFHGVSKADLTHSLSSPIMRPRKRLTSAGRSSVSQSASALMRGDSTSCPFSQPSICS